MANLPVKGNVNTMSGLKMRWNKTEQFVVENLFVFECFTAEDALKIFNTGIKNRIVAAHNMNNASSRSHCIFTMNVEQTSSEDFNNVVISKLQLVDLAGSERVGLTGNTGIAYKESIDINKSLLTLRKVINGLSDRKSNQKKAHIPYRESKLTCLLKQSLGGNSY
jgi:kinesin family protein 4/21/27